MVWAVGRRAGLRSAALLCLMGSVACSDQQASDGDSNLPALDDRRDVAAALGEHIVLPALRQFATDAEALEAAAEAWSSELSESDREASQAAWNTAAATWQRIELFQFGPAGAADRAAGGQDLRDEIYSWPLVNPCRVDQETAEGAFGDAGALAAENVNVRGLDALEYLLFNADTDNACAPNASLNTDGTWDALGDQVGQRRADHAAALAADLAVSARRLRQAWEPDDGNFLGELQTAGSGSAVYGSAQDALNAITDALFYLDTEVKDLKLAVPLGLTDCDVATCPDARESRWANRSAEHLSSNLAAVEALLLGSGGAGSHGFDDLLRALGAGDLADQLTADVRAARLAVDAIEPPLVDALNGDGEVIMAAYEAIKVVTDTLKTQFVAVLDLELPNRAEGDND